MVDRERYGWMLTRERVKREKEGVMLARERVERKWYRWIGG